ncbi:MAG TPA: FtsQ-type POTRA domain-containing protein [Candidatus Faecousia intestinigallinarum]|nr:FtsQ-type POTRA domain-containing protein [Candidatus Faecousia intestinigallinarum]
MDTKEQKERGTAPRRAGSGKRSTNTGAQRAASRDRRPVGSASPKAAPARKRRTPPKRQNARTREQERRRRAPAQPEKPRRSMPEVVYTPPKPFNRKRLLLRLTSVVAVVLALSLGMSIFFKVSNVTVSGTKMYTPWDVREASGIQEGENLISLNKLKAYAKILEELPYVETVRIGIKLPDTVNIEITEREVVYAVRDTSGFFWLMASSGKVVEQVESGEAANHTQILGVTLASPAVGQQAVAAAAASSTPDTTDTTEETEEGETDASLPSDPLLGTAVQPSDQLAAALNVLQYLEANAILGQVVSVDVTEMSRIVLWYGDRYEVILGDNSRLDEKISKMAAFIRQASDYQTGTVDVSYTIWPDQLGFTPFSEN